LRRTNANMPIFLKNQTSAQLHAALGHAGVSAHLARRLLAASVKHGELPSLGSDLTARLRDNLLALTEIPHLTQVQKVVSPQDGFTKYLFRGQGTGQFEAVRIPLLHRPEDLKYVACVSSQVGCAMGCAF
jgi:23S rRNA (adenine2503-C2)-methyltransferase